jgi:hypothetical protein
MTLYAAFIAGKRTSVHAPRHCSGNPVKSDVSSTPTAALESAHPSPSARREGLIKEFREACNE